MTRARQPRGVPLATPAEALRHLLKPGFDAVVMRAEVVAEEMVRVAVNSALEDAARLPSAGAVRRMITVRSISASARNAKTKSQKRSPQLFARDEP